MISWIQKYFQKHFRLVFGVVLVAIALPMVVIYSQSSGLGHGGSRMLERPFFGHNLGNEQDGGQLVRDGNLSAQLMGGYQLSGAQIEQYAMSRAAALALADELHLPSPSEKDVGAYIASLGVFRDQQGNFDQKRYADFADSLKTNPQFSIADANRVLRDDTQIKAVQQLVGGPGYALPADVRAALEISETKWSVGVATLDYATFDPGVNASEEALKKFFDENAGNYAVAERPKLRLIEFKGQDFVSNEPVSDEQLRAYYNANPARFPAPPEPAKDPKAPAAATDPFSKVRIQIELSYRFENATRIAVKAANDFAVALYESKAAANSSDLAAFLSAQKRTATDIPPFSPDAPPAGLTWLAAYGDQISRLGKDHYFSDVLPTQGGAAVLLWTETLPAYQPQLSEVHDKVAADFKEREKRKAFIARGQTLRAQLEAALKNGTPFEKAAAAEKLEVKSFANFTLRNLPKDLPQQTLEAVQDLKAGQVAPMIATADKGYLLYAAQRQLPAFTPTDPQFVEIRNRIMTRNSTDNVRAILTGLVETELQKTAPASATR